MSALNKTNILIIEDNTPDYKLLEHHLQEASIKHDLFRADTLFEGIEIALEKPIDIVLLDLSLPDSTGFKTLSKFLDRVNAIPVILMTGMNNEIVGNQAIKAGAQDFLVKGQFDGKLLGRSIRYSLQRYKTQNKLRETARDLEISERRFLEAQEMASFGNWEMDIVSNEMSWTDEIFRIFERQPNSFSPTLSDYVEYVHAEDRNKVETFFENAAKDSELHSLEHRIVSSEHKVRYLKLQARISFEESNKKILLVGAIQDITERKISEQLILEKNVSKNTFHFREEAMADIGFHIRTPLSSIVNLLFLLEKTNEEGQQKEYIDGLKTSVDDLSIMVNNMLNFSMLASEELKLEESEFKIKDLLKSMNKVLQIKADKNNADINLKWEESLPEVVVSDSNKITQILYNIIEYNLLSNTAKSILDIQLNHQQGADVKSLLEISICDKKTWLDTKAIKELFDSESLLQNTDPKQTKNRKEIGRLGFAVALKLLKTLKGTINISNKENEGTEYRIEIPVERVHKRQRDGAGLPEIPIKILLVEDHFLNQIATKKVLTTWSDKITVDIAENGLIAVEKCRAYGYDLILMDLQMPVMGGLESAKRIRETDSVPIVALTANASKPEMNKCKEIGINDYLSKPFQPEDLYDKILSLLVPIAGE
ncbi:MAG: response regulator [Saprospiraceae bacterium]